jgi:Zn-dependent protease
MGLISVLTQYGLVEFLVVAAALVFTLSVHEAAHAWAADLLGDPTARRMGRLTLNPLAHLDPIGSLMILLIGFGYAKPVPFNPYNLRNQLWGPVLVAAAGPASNFFFGVVCALSYGWLLPSLGTQNLLIILLSYVGFINFGLMFFNLIPVPPLDGSKALLALLSGPQHENARRFIETQGPNILMLLIVIELLLNVGIFSWIGSLSEGLFSLLS